MTMAASTAKERLRRLEQLYLSGVQQSDCQAFSLETLLDVLIVLYDECCSSTLRREKNVTEFVDYGEAGYNLLCIETMQHFYSFMHMVLC